mmetsp:Transcript_7519/g.15993  ORF Transcript_7519/g.15993 Transcript_7519/m.15993 type:complete len:248 (+) Transcript_7519:49-792(+)
MASPKFSSFQILLFGLLILVPGAVAMTCECEPDMGAVCTGILQIDSTTCVVNSFACNKCVCKTGGSFLCEVVESETVVQTGEDQCEIQTVEYAQCPTSDSLPTASPTPVVPPTSSGLIWGNPGDSCDMACESTGNSCNANAMNLINEQVYAEYDFEPVIGWAFNSAMDKLAELLGFECIYHSTCEPVDGSGEISCPHPYPQTRGIPEDLCVSANPVAYSHDCTKRALNDERPVCCCGEDIECTFEYP